MKFILTLKRVIEVEEVKGGQTPGKMLDEILKGAIQAGEHVSRVTLDLDRPMDDDDEVADVARATPKAR